MNSVYRHAQLPDDRPELRDLPAQHRVLLRGSRAHRLGREIGETFHRVGVAHRGGRFTLQPLDDLTRGLRRSEQTIPALRLEFGKTQLAEGWNGLFAPAKTPREIIERLQ